MMSVSVCIATFNGDRFIEEQLESVLRQTRQPDEVIVCDDCSTDKTAEKVQDFIRSHGLEEKWRLFRNQENRGYPGNFYYAMGLCTGQVVFLGDQDDVWAETKLERMLSALEARPEAVVMACKFGLIDSEDERIHSVMAPSHSLGTGAVRQIGIRDIFYKYEWPGMVLAYRNGWYQGRGRLGMEETGQIPHDIFLCAMAAEEGAFFQLDETLAYHRRHEDNTAAEEHRIGRLLNKERKLWEVEKYLGMLRAFEVDGVLRTEGGREALERKLRTMEGRYEALLSGKMSRVLREAFRNWGEVRVATVVCDLFIVRR